MMQLTDTRILITIAIQDDGADLLYVLALVTTLFGALARAGRFVAYCRGWVEDIGQAVSFTGKVFTIGLKSLAYGFCGVSL